MWSILFVAVGGIAVVSALVVLWAPDKIFQRPILNTEYDLFGDGKRSKRSLSPVERSFNEAVNRMIYAVDEKLRIVRVWFAVVLLLIGLLMLGTGATLL